MKIMQYNTFVSQQEVLQRVNSTRGPNFMTSLFMEPLRGLGNNRRGQFAGDLYEALAYDFLSQQEDLDGYLYSSSETRTYCGRLIELNPKRKHDFFSSPDGTSVGLPDGLLVKEGQVIKVYEYSLRRTRSKFVSKLKKKYDGFSQMKAKFPEFENARYVLVVPDESNYIGLLSSED